VALLAVAAAVVVATAVLRGVDLERPLLLAAVFVLLLAFSERLAVNLVHGEATEALSADEAILVAAALLLDPAEVLLAFFLGLTIGNVVLLRRPALKAVFNVSQMTLAAAGALAVMSAAGPLGDPGPLQLGLVVLGALVFAALNSAFLSGVFALVEGVSPWYAFRSRLSPWLPLWAGTVSLGMLAGLVARSHPAAVVFVLVSGAALYLTLRQHVRATRERQMLGDLLQASKLVHGAITADEVERTLVEATTRLLRCRIARITEDPPADGAVGVELEAEEGRRWLVASEKLGPDPFDHRDGELLEALATIGAVALRNATLLDQRRADRERLEELVRSKDEFVAAVSHELRTPLTAVVGFLLMLGDEEVPLEEGERREMLAHAARESQEVAAIVEDLLVAARIDIGRLTVLPEAIDLLEEVRRVSGPAVEIRGESVSAWADPVRVRQILRNLVQNAQGHGGPHVEIEVATDGPWTVVWVTDDGAAIPAGDREHIFEPYWRRHSAGGQPSSLGLGLTVSRRLARLMGGDVHNRREEGRTVFEMRLPASEEGRRALIGSGVGLTG
jgi:signal transduction histidine kinase